MPARGRTGFVSMAAPALLVLVAAAGCAGQKPPPSGPAAGRPIVHVVRPGETIYSIAQRYGVGARRLAAANRLGDGQSLRVGQRLVIPLGAPAPARAARLGTPRAPPVHHEFAWPIAGGRLASGFGIRNGAMHHGIDIDAPAGTPVRAAEAGVVSYAGRMRGYGNVIIVRHAGGFATVYAHNRANLVRSGQAVRRGQTLARVGSTGRATGANLHFEVRYRNVAYDPLTCLPAPEPSPPHFARAGEPLYP